MVDSVFQFKAVKPKQLRIGAVRANILNALKDEGKHAVSLLNETIATWVHDKPTMISEIGYKGGDVVMIAGPTGNMKGVKKWHWLNLGTHVRYAALSTQKDGEKWVSKTKIRTLRSGRGAGWVVARGKRAGRHRGIDPRGWTEIINKMMRKTFHRKIQSAVTRGIQTRG